MKRASRFLLVGTLLVLVVGVTIGFWSASSRAMELERSVAAGDAQVWGRLGSALDRLAGATDRQQQQAVAAAGSLELLDLVADGDPQRADAARWAQMLSQKLAQRIRQADRIDEALRRDIRSAAAAYRDIAVAAAAQASGGAFSPAAVAHIRAAAEATRGVD